MNSLTFVFLLSAVGVFASSQGVSVDIGADADGGTRPSAGWQAWHVSPCTEARATLGKIMVTLRPGATSEPRLHSISGEQGLSADAAVTSDGVYVVGGSGAAVLEVVIKGLSPGMHTFRSCHHSLWKDTTGPYRVYLEGKRESGVRVSPTRHAPDDEDAAWAELEFEARTGHPVVIHLESEDVNLLGRVILNGFQIDPVAGISVGV